MPVSALGEHGVEAGDEALLAAHRCDKSFWVVGHIPGVVAGGSLGDVTLAVDDVGIALETAVGMPPVGISGRGIDDVAPVASPLHQLAVVVVVAKGGGHLRHGEIVKGIFQRARRLLVLVESLLHAVLHRDEAILQVRLQGATPHAVGIVLVGGRRLESVLPHGLVGFLRIKPTDALDIGIGVAAQWSPIMAAV